MAGPIRTCCASGYCTGAPHNHQFRPSKLPVAHVISLHQMCAKADLRVHLIGGWSRLSVRSPEGLLALDMGSTCQANARQTVWRTRRVNAHDRVRQ